MFMRAGLQDDRPCRSFLPFLKQLPSLFLQFLNTHSLPSSFIVSDVRSLAISVGVLRLARIFDAQGIFFVSCKLIALSGTVVSSR